MASRNSATGATTQTLSVGGDATSIAQVAGNGNTVTATGNVSAGMPAEVRQALQTIQAALSAQPATKALTDAAMQQATTAEPDKSAIGGQLKAALDIAKTTLGWANLAEKLAPFLGTAADWLGGEWVNLLKP
jgi:hypothetical protein